jgi:cell wall assembly regulator SMI1
MADQFLERLNLAFTTIKAHSQKAIVQPITEQAISRAEKELETTFPKSYYGFLKEIGAASWPENIYGLGTDSDWASDIVHHTIECRTELIPLLPAYLIPFCSDGWGNEYCLDTRSFQDEECPVVLWNHELPSDQTTEVVSQNFLEWLEEAIKDQLEFESEEATS